MDPPDVVEGETATGLGADRGGGSCPAEKLEFFEEVRRMPESLHDVEGAAVGRPADEGDACFLEHLVLEGGFGGGDIHDDHAATGAERGGDGGPEAAEARW